MLKLQPSYLLYKFTYLLTYSASDSFSTLALYKFTYLLTYLVYVHCSLYLNFVLYALNVVMVVTLSGFNVPVL